MYQETKFNALMLKFTQVFGNPTIENIYRNIRLKLDLQQWFVSIKLHRKVTLGKTL